MVEKLRKIPKLTNKEKERFWSLVEKGKKNDCWAWKGSTSTSRNKRGNFRINGVRYRAPRISFFLHNGYIDNNLFCCHSCDNPNCVNPKHLYLGTQKQNMADMSERERGARQKLTKEQIIQIRKNNGKLTHRQLGNLYDVGYGTIGKIIRNERWKHVK